MLRHGEWGYKIAGIIGTKELEETHGAIAPFLPQDADVDQILANKAIDEVIYIRITSYNVCYTKLLRFPTTQW